MSSSKRWADVEDNEEDVGSLFDIAEVTLDNSADDAPTKGAKSQKHQVEIERIASPFAFSFMKKRY
jgi:hypothetical protein